LEVPDVRRKKWGRKRKSLLDGGEIKEEMYDKKKKKFTTRTRKPKRENLSIERDGKHLSSIEKEGGRGEKTKKGKRERQLQ